MTLIRTTKNYAGEEGVSITKGIAGEVVWSLTTGETYKTITETICLAKIKYTVKMTDSYGDGWSSGSNLVLKIGETELGTYTLNSGKTGSASFSLMEEYPFGSAWKHTNSAQTGSGWRTEAVTWDETIPYPDVTSTTRYFRRTVAVNRTLLNSVVMSIKTNTGFVAYLNGEVLYKWNMPEGEITSSTYALSSTTTTPRAYSALTALFPSLGSSMELAVEVHATASTVSGEETFDASFYFGFGGDDSRIDSDGVADASHSATGAESVGYIFDGTTSTKWSYSFTTSATGWATWTFNDGRRETINRYYIATANDVPGRDPHTWNVYGSNDPTDSNSWVILDSRTETLGTDRLTYHSFDMSNLAAFNAYKLEILERESSSVNMVQLSEWDLILGDVPVVLPGISYPETSYSVMSGLEVTITPEQNSGYNQWTISGPGGVSLPSGLTINADTGVISGTPTAGQASTVYTVSANYIATSTSYSTTLTLTVEACTFPTHSIVRVTKSQNQITGENFQILNGEETIYSYTSSSAATAVMCLAAGTYTVAMQDSAGTAWDESSFVTIEILVTGSYMTIAKIRQTQEADETTYFSVVFPISPMETNTSVKYLADGTVPANWYTSSFSDSSWTTFSSSPRPSTANKILLFRTTFNVASKTNIHGFELRLKARWGVVVYLNGNELYRRYVTGDITSSTTAEGGKTTAYWRSIVGRATDLNLNNNVLAVALVNMNTAAATVDFDMIMRLMSSTVKYPRYWDVSSTDSELFDLKTTTRYYKDKSTEPEQSITLTLSDDRAEVFNKYCIVTNWDTPRSDPREWEISGSNDDETYTTIKTETEVYFEDRLKSYCFYMPTSSVAYTFWRLTLKKARSDDTSNYYSLVQWNLFLEDLSAAEVPTFAMTPSTLVGYTGASFPVATASSVYYTGYTIEPTLPSGLHLNSNDGAITGVLSEPLAASTYTLSAINHLGETKQTTISIAVEICGNDKISFTLEFTLSSGASTCSYELKDMATGTVVDYRDSLIDYSTMTVPMCSSATTYTLVLKKTTTAGWGSNHVSVKLADGTTLLTESLAAGVTSKEYNFNPAYVIPPRFTEWNYLVDGSEAPSGWNTVSGAPAWSTAMPKAFPVATGVTQYYYKKFTVESMDEFSTFDVTVSVKAGAIIYLNGQEIRRVNLPEAEVTASTAATQEYSATTDITTGLWVQANNVVVGENILAVELHRYESNEASNSFDGSAIFILNGMYMVINGVGSTTPAVEGDTGSDKAFDNNSSTMTVIDTMCVGAIFDWTWDNERREVITNYGIMTTSTCNNRHPSGWVISGSNDGENWTMLQQKYNQLFTQYSQQLRLDFYNDVPYNKYRLEVMECNNNALDTECTGNSVQLADLYLFTKRQDDMCAAVGEFKPALNGDYSYVSCPDFYEGTRQRLCVDGVFNDEENLCSVVAPERIYYEQNPIELYRNKLMTPVKPILLGKEIVVTIFPTLPSGLSLNSETGEISGTPTDLYESARFTVTGTNSAGNIKTYISISVVEAPINWTLIIILIVVVVIIVVVIIVAIVMVVKGKSKKTKKMPKNVKNSKPVSKTTPVKTKAEVKV